MKPNIIKKLIRLTGLFINIIMILITHEKINLSFLFYFLIQPIQSITIIQSIYVFIK